MPRPPASGRAALLTPGCARNEVDSEELAGRPSAEGWDLVDAVAAPDVPVVNTRGFVAAAKEDSVDALLAAVDTGARVVAVGCLAERYGAELADAPPEADAVLGFGAYPRIAERLTEVVAGHRPAGHVPTDRQAAETRPGLLAAIATTPGVAPYFDLSLQHASKPVLRRMRRFGSRPAFLSLCERIRALAPDAGVRGNVIVGFPGETEDDLAELEAFLVAARLDAVGVFGYSDEDRTETASFDGKLDDEEIAARVAGVTDLVEQLTAQRAEDRVAEEVAVLVERVGSGECAGRAAHQAPEVDGECLLPDAAELRGGDLVRAEVIGAGGADLVVAPWEVLPREVQSREVQSREVLSREPR